tara:strand:+ start:412 stop:1191 length:780 start_codon:yes stop_codon:yes gene_type:complete
MIKIFPILFSLSIIFSTDIVEQIVGTYRNGAPEEIEFYKKNEGELLLIKLLELYPDGQIRLEGNYKDGIRHGRWVWYHKNGIVNIEGNYTDGLQDGKWMWCYVDGPPMKKGSFSDGECSGDWTFYESTGIKIKVKQCSELSSRDLRGIYIKDPKAEDENNKSKEAEFVAYDKAPVAIIPIKLTYPSIAKARGLEGDVYLKIFVDKNGNVDPNKIIILKGVVGLNEAAIEAVKKTKWKPAMQRNRKVGVYMTIPIKFRLN